MVLAMRERVECGVTGMIEFLGMQGPDSFRSERKFMCGYIDCLVVLKMFSAFCNIKFN